MLYTDEPSHELWVDACAFLPTEMVAEVIFDECGYCPVSDPLAATLDNTEPSGSPQKLRSTSSHLELPPIKRWSSSDSWASALSDWIQSVSVHSENSAFKDDNVALEESQSGQLAGRLDGPDLLAVDTLYTPDESSKSNPQETTVTSGNCDTSRSLPEVS